MTVYLGVVGFGYEPYNLDLYDLDDAIRDEADTIALDAGSDLLEEGTEECRQLLRDQLVTDMIRALRGPGDVFRAPDGTRYAIYEKDD